MKKYTYIAAKVIFSLIIFIPIFSLVAILSGQNFEPLPEYYNTAVAYEFIVMLMDTAYITYINAIIFTIGLVLLWTKRTALAAVIIFPITVNVVAFHAFIDGGLFTGGALMGNVMFIINLYFFWYHWEQYKQLLSKDIY